MQRIRMLDIANKAEVSLSCVARYLNDTGYVSEAKREAIGKAVEELGYVPNRTAKILRGENSHLIGHICTYADENIMFSKMAMALEREAYARGYQVITFFYEEGKSSLQEMFDTLISYHVDGVILNCAVAEEHAKELQRYVREVAVPVIMIERCLDIYEIDKVLFNYSEGSYVAARQLLLAGHECIGYIGRKRLRSVEIERFAGYQTALKERNIEVPPEWIRDVEEYTIQNGYEAARDLLRSDIPFTAIFASSDLLAAGVLRAAAELGISVPEKLSVVGYDDTIAEYMTPPLSTLRLPLSEVAKAVLEILIDKSKGTSQPSVGKTISLSPLYIERASVGKRKEMKSSC